MNENSIIKKLMKEIQIIQIFIIYTYAIEYQEI